MMGAYDHMPYEVGKGKPPRRYRWKPGQSGNPKGRKPRANTKNETLNELLAALINEPVEVTIGGRKRRLLKKEIIILQMINDASNGTPTHRLKAFKQLSDLGAFDLMASDQVDTPEEKEARIREIVDELAEEARREGAYDFEQ